MERYGTEDERKSYCESAKSSPCIRTQIDHFLFGINRVGIGEKGILQFDIVLQTKIKLENVRGEKELQ
jgi:hypothetical protein